MSSKSKNIHFNRIYIIVSVILLFWILLEIRLYQVQIKNHEYYAERSIKQVEHKQIIPASRGIIYDKNDVQLATNIIHYDLGVDKNLLENKNALVKSFSKVFGKSRKYYLRKIEKGSGFVFLERKVSENKMKLIDHITDNGFVKKKNHRRFYPFAEHFSQLIGFTDVDDKGASGLELQYQEKLKGKEGWAVLQVDAKRRFGYSAEHPTVDPVRGADIHLTIDKNFQTILSENLKTGVKKFNARRGQAILMDPNTGEILAMCAYPAFNSNYPGQSKPEHRKKIFISDVFEPGSTFKLFPMAALLQEGVKKTNDIEFCENGKYKLYDHTVRDSKKYAWLSLQRVFENSSNIGMVKFIKDLPTHIFYRYLKNFGFGSNTGVNLLNESSGTLDKPKNYSGISKGMISHGYEIGTTALQLTNAYCAVVNGGNLMRPFVIKSVVSGNNEILEEYSPEKIREVISEDVAEELKNYMVGTVKRGTGKKAQIEGYIAGGKTGTAQKYDSKLNKYIRGKYISSFIGFAPYENPEYVLSVFLDEPKTAYYGGETAAPIFKAIMTKLLKVSPEFEEDELDLQFTLIENDEIPNLKGLHINIAQEILSSKDIDYEIQGKGQYILSQVVDDGDMILHLDNSEIRTSQMPDLKGLTLREALKKIDFSKIRVKVKGSGKVKDQTVKAGTHINNSKMLLLSCSN